ncbi:MAG: lysophospholipid acyltransferase family protein [Salaquimonas sp.]|jgi:putative hemolysin|nr:lysophospholipid acyltransferase family protein [Salaquimonas sp.]
MRKKHKLRFPELSYASPADPKFKQWLIRRVERFSGREYFADYYEIWRSSIVGTSSRVMGDMLDLLGINLKVRGEAWPPRPLPETPLVMIANHPFGIGDGVAILALAEQLGRPFRVMIHKDLMRVPEIQPYSLPVSFEETREALQMNLQTRREAVRLLKEGVTIVVFPAGGVATAPKGLGRAEDLPWKMFPAKLIQSAGASVIPVYFEGQNTRLFHLISQISLTVRLSLLIREFRKLAGGSITAHVGAVIPAQFLARIRDRKKMTEYLYNAVFAMRPGAPVDHIEPADTRIAA